MNIPQFCETIMLIAFGISWPFNIAKSIRSKTARGKSIWFEFIVIFGYSVGLFGKFYTYRSTGILAYSTWFYIADLLLVSADIVLYFINARRDRLADASKEN